MHNDEYLIPITKRIGGAILEFCAENSEFHAEDLHRYVADQCGAVAPASADRVLRALRAKGLVDYTVRRGESFYTVLNVRAA